MCVCVVAETILNTGNQLEQGWRVNWVRKCGWPSRRTESDKKESWTKAYCVLLHFYIMYYAWTVNNLELDFLCFYLWFGLVYFCCDVSLGSL